MFYDNLLPPNSVPEQYCSGTKIMAYNNKTLILYLIDFWWSAIQFILYSIAIYAQ